MLAILTFRSEEDVLSPDEIVERLTKEFDEVRVDPEAGRRRASDELAILRRLNAPAPIIAMTEQGLQQARWVVVQEGGLTFGFMLMPEANIRINHDEALDPLIRRCAEVLNCDVDECG